MATIEIFIEIPSSKYGEGVMINEYNEEVSLVSARKAKGNGTNYMKWCFPERDKKPIAKAVPWKITIGKTRKEAATVLQKILAELAG